MAVSVTNLTTGVDTDGNSTATTASVAPSANKLQLLSIASRTGISANPNQPTVTSTGLTWVAINTSIYDTGGSSRRRVTLFRALGAAPSAGALSIDFGGQNQTEVRWVLDEVTGADTSGANGAGAVVQSAVNQDTSGTGTTLTVTLGAFTSTANATYGAFADSGTNVGTVGSGFAQIGQTGTVADTVMIVTEFKTANDTSVDYTFSAANEKGGVAIEIRAEIIMFDAAANSGYKTASSSYSFNHTVSTGNNRYLLVGVSMLSVAGSSVTGITYNGIAMTFIGAIASASGAVRSEIWGIVAPATGTNAVAITLSTGLDSIAGAISFTGVHQISPTEGYNSATATNVGAADATVNVTTVADNDWVVDTVATDDTAITVGAGQSSRWNVTGTLGSGAGSTEGPKTPAGAVTMSWTNVAALATWSIGAVALRDVNAASLVVNQPEYPVLTGGKFWNPRYS